MDTSHVANSTIPRWLVDTAQEHKFEILSLALTSKDPCRRRGFAFLSLHVADGKWRAAPRTLARVRNLRPIPAETQSYLFFKVA